ncbi:MAG: hypothetical protein EOO22_16045, partial [Comamonadaceae bacterium]
MNKSYRSIWNESLGAWVAASEITSARGKKSQGGRMRNVVRVSAIMGAIALMTGSVWADVGIGYDTTNSDTQSSQAAALYSYPGSELCSTTGSSLSQTLGSGISASTKWNCLSPNGKGGISLITGIPGKDLAPYSNVGSGFNNYYPDTERLADYVPGANAIAFGTITTLAQGDSSVAIGDGAQAIGTGNGVNGNNSGAIGDPSIIDGANSYSVGNNNKLATDDTFVLGNNVTATTKNGVVLGSNSSATRGAVTAVANPLYNAGAASVGNVNPATITSV